ncbi:hypothetical protein M1439_02660 [Candidatus Marsarchaeota archaeon]|jgi:DNA-directed RNA polymerase subunit L|nr:hypothetical protein [Candidatus Marsarchaeota archaeon]MCL5092410.1 hypothetical protein [Candidatus Marsarchaeota archaeon]
MELQIIKNENKELMIEFQSGDLTMPDLIASELLNNPDVEFAGVKKDHPEVGKPILVVKTNKKKAMEAVEKALENIDEQFAEIKKALNKK